MFYFKNASGLCAQAIFCPLMSVHARDIVMAHVASGKGSKQLQEACALLEQFPQGRPGFLVPVSEYPGDNNFAQPPTQYGYALEPLVGLWYADTFKSNAPSNDRGLPANPSPDTLGWSYIAQLNKLVTSIQPELVQLGVSLSPERVGKALRNIKRRSEWILVEVSVGNILEVDAFAIYLVGSKGFVNDKGCAVPLAGARMFESEAAALRTITSHKWKDAVVVSANLRVEGLGMSYKGDPAALGLLSEALAHRHAEEIDAATPQAAPSSSTRYRL